MDNNPNSRQPAAQYPDADAREQSIDIKVSEAMYEIQRRQSIVAGLVAGAIAMAVAAVLWALFVALTKYQIGYIAILVGVLVGFAVKNSVAALRPSSA